MKAPACYVCAIPVELWAPNNIPLCHDCREYVRRLSKVGYERPKPPRELERGAA